ncbi:MAG: TIGR01458 family HAD-type hydrolase [Methanolinea sp.]|nr:TIGR01458 family HAD-type hydrolase [Methanolinea sp.]
MVKFRGFLIDLDGVVYTGTTPLPGAAATIAWLQECGYPFRYISNSTRRSVRSLVRMLGEWGISATPGMVLTPAVAAADLIRKRSGSRVFLLTTEDVREDFSNAGLVPSRTGCDAVVIGDCGDSFTYSSLNGAFRLIHEGVPFIALEKDRYFRDTDGLSLSAGPFVVALEYATGRKAELVGKPSPEFFRAGLRSLGLAPGEAAMIGDDVVSDIGGAMGIGMGGLLVRTGKFSPESLAQARKPPTAVIASIASLREYLEGTGPE